MKKISLNNKGFSLLELLIGITMLAIIVVPILHAFLTSSKTSAKAKEVRNETVAAQNVLESYEATDIGAIIQDIKSHEMPFGDIASSAKVYISTGGGNFSEITSSSTEVRDGPAYKICLKNVAAGGKAYDAVLNIDASKFNNRNSVGIVDYKPMDTVFPPPKLGDDSNPDVVAAKDIASQAQIDSGISVDYHYFLDRMTRKITMTIQELGADTGIISCTFLFHYTAHYTYELTDDSTDPPTVTNTEKDYTAAVIIDFPPNHAGGENGLYGLYFFFNPNIPIALYPNTPGDTIEIVNRNNIDMSIYLIKQDTAGSYNPAINLREQAPFTTKPHAQMYYNSDYYTYRYYIGYLNSGGDFSDYWYNTFQFNGDLVGTPAQNRLYGVTVTLYSAGTIDANGSVTGAPITSFDASSLESN